MTPQSFPWGHGQSGGNCGGARDQRGGGGIRADIEACPACAEEARRARALWGALGAAPAPAAGPEFALRLGRALDRAQAEAPRPALRTVAALGVACALGLAALLGAVTGREGASRPAPVPEVVVAEWPVAGLERVPTGSVAVAYGDLLTGGDRR